MDSGNMIKTSGYQPLFAQDKHGYACCTVRYLEEALNSLYWGFERGAVYSVYKAFWVADRYVNVLMAKRSGKGAEWLVEEVKLSCYSCYHILQNVNSSKNDVTLTRFRQVNKKNDRNNTLCYLHEGLHPKNNLTNQLNLTQSWKLP